MPYLYETHLHTSEGSACGEVTGPDYIDYMIGKGYSGFVVTDHFFTGNCAVDRTLPWDERVHLYCEGYRKAKESAEGKDFDVIFGIEYNFDGDEFLIYGLDGKWLLDNPDVIELDRQSLHKRVNASGGIMVHAHPFRERNYLKDIKLTPDACDGIEVYNAANSDNMNALAYRYAQQLRLPMTGGSDIHYFHDRPMGGVLVPHRVTNTVEFKDAFTAGLMTPVQVKDGKITPVTELPEQINPQDGPTFPVFLTNPDID